MRILFSYLIKYTLVLIAILFLSSDLIGQTSPVIGLHENVPKVILLTNARIVIAPGKILENGQMLIRNDHIESLGKVIKQPADAIIRDLKGKTIYPGFIDLFSNYGLNNEDKQFLINFKKLSPEWDLYDFKDFPAVQWKMKNLEVFKKKNEYDYYEAVRRLADFFE